MSTTKNLPRALLRACAPGAIALALGCATAPEPRPVYPEPPSASETFASAPDWVVRGCRAHWTEGAARRQVVCGVGSARAVRNRVAARETAIARARSAVARSLEVTIESLVRLDDRTAREADLDTIVHQLSSTSLRGVQLEDVWRADTGEVHALVSLDLDRVQKSVRANRTLSPAARESLAQRAAAAFAELDAAFAEDGGPAVLP